MKLTTTARKKIPKKEYGLPGKKTKGNPAGHGAYPMPDKNHARLAKAYASRFASPSERATIDAKANKVLGKGKKK